MQTLNLIDPGKQYRPVPFWSWNDELDPAELRHQIREMDKAGLGGFFMHARGGLKTQYLSPEWMACVEACLDEAGKLGMNAWLYDENGWPSGFGGGLVNNLGEKYQQKYLRLKVASVAEARKIKQPIGYYTRDGATFLGTTLPKKISGEVLTAYYDINPYYVDNLDREVVAEFIRVTHQHYYENLPKKLLKHLRGIFTDEPQLSRNGLVWSLVLPAAYQAKYGVDLLPQLPALEFDLPWSGEVRIRFWSLVAEMFNENFMKQIRQWCDKHKWMITGHHVLEEWLNEQIPANGTVMSQYQYYNIPGIDHLCRTLPSTLAQIQLVSAAAQFGQKQILTESFALTGWNMNFSGMKWMFQQQLAHGVNFLCQHLQSYTLRGLRKRDYPPSLFIHQPWWEDYKKLNDYFSRAGMVLAEGRANVRVLVVHPISSAWKHLNGQRNNKKVEFYTDALRNLSEALKGYQVEHHYLDPVIFEKYGSLQKNGEIKVNLKTYDVVILPQISDFTRKMADVLTKFSQNNLVIRVRNTFEPELTTVDGKLATLPFLDNACSFDSEDAAARFAALVLKNEIVSVCENGVATQKIYTTDRYFADFNGREAMVYFFANTAMNSACYAEISIPCGEFNKIEALNLFTGQLMQLDHVIVKNGWAFFRYPFAEGGGLMIVCSAKRSRNLPLFRPENVWELPAVKKLADEFALAGYTGNLFTIDRCRYRVDGGEWVSDDISVIQEQLLALRKNCKLEMELEFFCDDDFNFEQDLELGVENPERFDFALNGVAFGEVDNGMLFDQAFRRLALPKSVKKGRNVIAVNTVFRQNKEVYQALKRAEKFETERNKLTFDWEIESMYLVGDFSVRHHGPVVELDRKAVRYQGAFTLGGNFAGKTLSGNLLFDGMPFFAGKCLLTTKVNLTKNEVKNIRFLRFAQDGANSYQIRINGKNCGTVYWAPYAVDVGDLLAEGENLIEVEVTTSLRNLLGPFHLAEGESYAVHTMSFTRRGQCHWLSNDYNPYYCFVKLGVSALELV